MIMTLRLVCAKSNTTRILRKRLKTLDRCAWTVTPVRFVTGAFRDRHMTGRTEHRLQLPR